MDKRLLPSAIWLLVLLSGAPAGALAQAGNYSPYVDRGFAENLYWGDTHLHTNRSADAYSFGDRYTAELAYRFARGETVETQAGQTVRLGRPLDFLVISDHAQFLGYFPLFEQGDESFLASEIGQLFSDAAARNDFRSLFDRWGAFVSSPEPVYKDLPRIDDSQIRARVWKTVSEEADRYNEPGVFTAFIGYEWTSMPETANLHRVVMFRDGASKTTAVVPFSVIESRDPEALWQELDRYETVTGGRAMAIPHNGNLSKGNMFSDRRYGGGPMTRQYAEQRARWEPVTEVTQVKGDGETHPALSPGDRFADYETWGGFSSSGTVGDSMDGAAAMIKDNEVDVAMLRGDYARSALMRGLELEQTLGVNPYRFGMIGSSDIHTSLSTVEESNFFSKMPFEDPSAERGRHQGALFTTREYAASGLAAVWAPQNTRESLFDAMQRREAYATTGSRIRLRFFGGWEFDELDHARPDYVAIGYQRGVPMGGDLSGAPQGRSPRFLIVSAKDPEGANLERIQVIKGWINASGEAVERVWDVALSDGRVPQKNGEPSDPIASTVDIETARYTNTVGNAELSTVWEDPDFDPSQGAFYYARVLEIQTPRWTTYDTAFYGGSLAEGVPAVHQERAYSSPIWYTPDSRVQNAPKQER